jgi:predicted HD phosphohydrolase
MTDGTARDVRLESVDDVVALYDSPHADVLYDEAVTELEHGLQAATLARAAGADEPLVAAALLHDIGHLLLRDLQPIGEELKVDHRHDQVGADALQRLFGSAVADPVRLHVAAKRYLCTTEREYALHLSPSSVRSLAVQGGLMSGAEVAEFERYEAHRDAVNLRRWDDEAKVGGLVVDRFATWVPMLQSLALA